MQPSMFRYSNCANLPTSGIPMLVTILLYHCDIFLVVKVIDHVGKRLPLYG